MSIVGLLQIVLTLALVGVVIWAITTYLPMPDVIKTVIYIVVAIVVILWLIGLLGGGLALPSLGTHGGRCPPCPSCR